MLCWPVDQLTLCRSTPWCLYTNYSCLQNPWLGSYRPQIPVLSSVLNWICWTHPNKIPGYATAWLYSECASWNVVFCVLCKCTAFRFPAIRKISKNSYEYWYRITASFTVRSNECASRNVVFCVVCKCTFFRFPTVRKLSKNSYNYWYRITASFTVLQIS